MSKWSWSPLKGPYISETWVSQSHWCRDVEVAQSYVALCNPMVCSLPGSSVCELYQARVLEWVAISFSRASSQLGDRTQVSRIKGRHFTLWATREAHRDVDVRFLLPGASDFESNSSVQSCPTLCDPMDHQASLSFTNSQSLLRLMSIESVMPSNHLIFYCSVLLLPSIFPSIRVFNSESVLLIRLPKYWSFSFSISLCNEYSGLISFRIDWFDLLAVRGTLKSLL